jgi:hypothetical protein
MLAPLVIDTLPPEDALLDPALASIDPPAPVLCDTENTIEPLVEVELETNL